MAARVTQQGLYTLYDSRSPQRQCRLLCWACTLQAAPQDLSLGLPSSKMRMTAVMSSTPAGGFLRDLASPAA